MATLDPTIQQYLNAFSQSQPALNIVGQHSTKGVGALQSSNSGIQLGDLLAQALAGGDASSATYEPTTPSNWASAPATVKAALDDVATKTMQNQLYTPATPGNWSGSAPASMKAAIDRLAAAVEGLLAAPIP